MCRRPMMEMMIAPKHHTTTIGTRLLPHWMLRPATLSLASTSIATMPRFDGFQMWRPSTRMRYFDVIEIAAHSAYGQKAGDRTSIPTLIPDTYALARCGHLPVKMRPRVSSTRMDVAIARAVRDQLSRKPNVICPATSTHVTRIGARKRLSIRDRTVLMLAP